MDFLQRYLTTCPAALALLSGLALVLFGFVFSQFSRIRSLPVPPGPPQPNWLLGHLSILPSKRPWETYFKWAQQYGPILHLRAFNQRIIILSSLDDCIELCEKRSGLYSNRPSFPMLDLMGWDYATAIMPYGQRWRSHRRVFHQLFRREKALLLRTDQTRKVKDMLHGLLASPEDFREHVKTLSAAIVMSATYGYDISPKKDYFVELSEAAVVGISSALVPGATMVNVIPALRYLPTWFPGTQFHKIAADVRKLTTRLRDVPFNWTLNKIQAGEETECIIARLLPSCTSPEQVVTLKEICANIYSAGADTTTASLNTFFYVMAAVSPRSQLRAQEEIDRVVGPNRLPTYEDWDNMPYTEAIVRELLRFNPVFPLGTPRHVTEDDVFKGYHISKGTIVIPNLWAISRNPDKYEKPEMFNPERFLDEDGNLTDDDAGYVFGFGRRVCPGRHMARATIWLAIATTLWAFRIEKAKDSYGNEIPISGEFLDGLIRHPLPHACSIVPRSREVERIIEEAVSK